METQKKRTIRSFLQSIFWMLLFMKTYVFTANSLGFQKGFLASLLAVSILIIIAYTNMYIIIPQFFIKRKFKLYILAMVGLLLFSILWNWVLNSFFIKDVLLEVRLIDSNEPTKSVHRSLKQIRLIVSFFVSIGVLFISTVYKLVLEFIKKERIETALRIEKHQNELKFLRSQINPHFLFNALNNLHATAYLNPQKVGDSILKLGEMLRYVIYECSKEKVSLRQEINYIKHYIFFQQQKDKDLKQISIEILGQPLDNYILEPMLLIPFVENAFKHSYSQDLTTVEIRFKIHIIENTLHFTAMNTIGTTITTSDDNKTVYSGVGIENVLRRLTLSYPEQHKLKYYQANGFYYIELTLYENKK